MRVLLADDHRLILQSVRRALEDDGGFAVVAETSDGADVLPLVDEHRPDVVVLDLRMPNRDGLQCLELIKQRYPEIRVIMLSASTGQDLIDAALQRGASAYVLKSVDPRDLPATIRQVVSGSVFVGPNDGQEAAGQGTGPARPERGTLTERESRILAEVARGKSNDEIAKELWVSQQTVKFHLTNVYRKLGVKNRTEALREAYRLGLIDSPLVDE